MGHFVSPNMETTRFHRDKSRHRDVLEEDIVPIIDDSGDAVVNNFGKK